MSLGCYYRIDEIDRYKSATGESEIESTLIGMPSLHTEVRRSFLNLQKRERIRRRVYCLRDEGRRDVFDYLGMFYNLKRSALPVFKSSKILPG